MRLNRSTIPARIASSTRTPRAWHQSRTAHETHDASSRSSRSLWMEYAASHAGYATSEPPACRKDIARRGTTVDPTPASSAPCSGKSIRTALSPSPPSPQLVSGKQSHARSTTARSHQRVTAADRTSPRRTTLAELNQRRIPRFRKLRAHQRSVAFLRRWHPRPASTPCPASRCDVPPTRAGDHQRLRLPRPADRR